MKTNFKNTDTIEKPTKPHRYVDSSEIPTKEEIAKRYQRIERLKSLGISVNILDSEEDDDLQYEEDIDKLKASILIMQDKELPKELEQKLLRKKEQQQRVK